MLDDCRVLGKFFDVKLGLWHELRPFEMHILEIILSELIKTGHSADSEKRPFSHVQMH